MLAALEERLARDGIGELVLPVNQANESARRLYAAAGYELVGSDDRVHRLRKRLSVEPIRHAGEDDAGLEEQ